MRVLVTDANGLLGSHLVRQLENDGHEVRALVRRGADVRPLAGLDCERVQGDVRELAAMRQAVAGCELVFHTTAVEATWGGEVEDVMSTATAGVKNVITAARAAGVRRVVLTSSAAVVGGNDEPTPLDEDARPPGAAGPAHFVSKARQEEAALAEAHALGQDLVLANPSVFIGPYDFRPSASLGTVTSYIRDPLHLTYPGGINLTHAADVARGHILLAERAQSRQRYILGAENCQWTTLHRTLAELLGLPPPRLRVGRHGVAAGAALMELAARLAQRPPPIMRELAGQVGRYFWYRHDKAARLGFHARPARDTLVETLAWLLDSPHLGERARRRLRPTSEVLDARDALRLLARARQRTE